MSNETYSNNINGRGNGSKKINDFRIWTHKRNTYGEDLFDSIDKNINRIKSQASYLYGESRNLKQKSKLRKVKVIRRASSVDNYPDVSPPMRKLLIKMNKEITTIKESTDQIAKMNGVYLDKYIYNNKSNEFNKSQSQKDLCVTNKQGKLVRNFSYINNTYRKQLNQAFMKFNPLLHLDNLKVLSKVDPEINKDINQMKSTIDHDLDEITDKYYYKKRYIKLLEQNKPKIIQTVSLTTNVKNHNSTLTHTLSNLRSSKRKPTQFPGTTRPPKLGVEVKKKFPKKELKLREMEQMTCALKNISELVSEDNVRSNIDNSYKDYIHKSCIHQREEYYNEESDEDIKLRTKLPLVNFFTPQNKRVVEIMSSLHLMNLKKNSRDQESVIKSKISAENRNFSEKGLSIKDNFIKDMEARIKKDKIQFNLV